MKMLTRRGVLIEEMGQTYLAEPDADGEEARTLRPLQAAAITYRIAFGPRAGQKLLTLRGAMPREGTARQPLCADIDGFSLHAAVRVEAHDRKRLEQLCRYITRPALSDDPVQLNGAGHVELKLKTPWRHGTTHLVMGPLEFMQRLAALVPRPRLQRTSQPDSGRSRATLDGRVLVATNARFQEPKPERARSKRRAALEKRDGPVWVVGCRPGGAGERPVTTKWPTFARCPATLSSSLQGVLERPLAMKRLREAATSRRS